MDDALSYIDSLPDNRREALSTVRTVILEHLPEGYEEVLAFGMLGYHVPLSRKNDTYNGKPLQYAALASQKNHMSIYLSAIYADPDAAADFEAQYKATGKRLDCGKSCVRFKKIDDLPLDVIGTAIARYSVSQFIEMYEALRQRQRS